MSALIWTVFGDKDQANDAIAVLLQEQLIGCANITPDMESIFLWNDKIEQNTECGVLIKTGSALLKDAVSRLEHLHPYETPAILGWHCSEVGVATEEWLGKLTGSDGHEGNSAT